MGWSHIPNMDNTTFSAEDNPFAGPKSQPTGKVFVCMPSDDWLCNKLKKLNLTLIQGYPSCSSEAGGLLKDQRSHRLSGTGCILTNERLLLLGLPLGNLMPQD